MKFRCQDQEKMIGPIFSQIGPRRPSGSNFKNFHFFTENLLSFSLLALTLIQHYITTERTSLMLSPLKGKVPLKDSQITSITIIFLCWYCRNIRSYPCSLSLLVVRFAKAFCFSASFSSVLKIHKEKRIHGWELSPGHLAPLSNAITIRP